MTEAPALARGRESFHRKAWGESYRLLEAADIEAPLEPQDLERLATAAYLIGRDNESEDYRARAHQMFLARGDGERAAGSALLACLWPAAARRQGSGIRLVGPC